MKIVQTKTKTKAMKAFGRTEWPLVHPEHFGHEPDKKYWEKVEFYLCAKEGNETLGMVNGYYMAGVMYIPTLIVGHKTRGSGVGQALMEEAEKIARKNRVHKIYLHTGSTWRAVDFYEKLGYKKTGVLKNHYEGRDFLVMSKML